MDLTEPFSLIMYSETESVAFSGPEMNRKQALDIRQDGTTGASICLHVMSAPNVWKLMTVDICDARTKPDKSVA